MKRVVIPTYTATIYVGGSYTTALEVCGRFCIDVEWCVTVEPLQYVWTHGGESGVRVGLINYGRFPAEPSRIWEVAEDLAVRLIEGLHQQTASIVAIDRTVWLSKRPDDLTPSPPTDGPKGQDGQEGGGS